LEEARSWLEDSLGQGFDLSVAVLAAGVLEQGRCVAIVPDDFNRVPFNFSHGGVVGQQSSRERLAKVLQRLGTSGARAVLVEDSTAGRTDPHFSHRGEPSAFIGERVIHWSDLSAGGPQAMEVVAWGTGGYPTNAFVLTQSSQDLGLVDRQDAPKDLAEEVAASLLAIVVAAFDAESYLLWLDHDSAERLVSTA